MNKTVVKVGIADLNIIQSPDKIRTSGLGSCVGIVLYDLTKQVAGLAHIMLPDSSLTKQKNYNKYKYADTAIDILIDKLIEKDVRKFSIKAKIAGGAQMFQLNSATDVMRIGPRNVEAVTKILHMHRIPIVASDVGGNSGRTIEFDPISGNLKIRTVNKGEKLI
ncbi:chemotaxis protein CheD [Pseudogracilibacillus auburnensis]|uniref:Probable chemoreceptor glutamine deamidase CheD n=1 Tax=Pseudogracilibacillus auburnensis TaxID=1494959 RepID=A0A2V3W6H7_9BACI|nr:chemotaxis protein CheD [Pseudogracilibacillus auburnensis]PXW88631.1 chemotaxis protein CheD [Pseudogracilibacillus auburnensis]